MSFIRLDICPVFDEREETLDTWTESFNAIPLITDNPFRYDLCQAVLTQNWHEVFSAGQYESV